MRIANAVCVLALVCCGCGHHPQDKEKPALPFPSHAEIQADLWQKQHVDECWASWDRINESRAKEIIEGKSPDEINAPNADTTTLFLTGSLLLRSKVWTPIPTTTGPTIS